jgi:hypothetical protein
MPTTVNKIRAAAVPETSSNKCALIDLAVLHDDEKILRRIRDNIDVRDGIAVDEQEVGKRAVLYAPTSRDKDCEDQISSANRLCRRSPSSKCPR